MPNLSVPDRPSRRTVLAATLGGTFAPLGANAEPLRIGVLNTGEGAILPMFDMNGTRDENTAARLDVMLRDWRAGQAVRMDRKLYDFLYVLQRVTGRAGVTSGVLVISGYRTAGSNAMLRGRSEAVALQSFHLLGQAVDFRIVGMPCGVAAGIAWAIGMGGVGLYGEEFVHVDTGPRRRWGDAF